MSIASRITSIEEHIGNAYDKLEDLGIDLTNVDKNINNIASMLEDVYNDYPKVTATGVTSARLSGTKVAKMNIDIKGNSVQDGTPNPASPVPIKSTGDNGSITEKIVGENVVNFATVSYSTANQGTASRSGADFTVTGGTIYSNCKFTQSNMGLSANTTYKFVARIQSTTNETGSRIYVGGTMNTTGSGIYSSDTQTGNVASVTFTTPAEIPDNAYIGLYPYKSGTTAVYTDIHIYIATQEQTYTIPVQQPMRKIGDVQDEFIQDEEGIWYERHNIAFIESYNGETITTDYISTTGGLDAGASIQYVADTPTDLTCTSEQVECLENLLKSYNEETNIYSLDVTPAYFDASALKGE